MKLLITIAFLAFTAQLSFGQACGIYRIKYVGSITSDSLKILSIKLPTTMYLHGVENDSSELSFVDAKIIRGRFIKEIQSHLTTPYSDKSVLLSYYKIKQPYLKVRIKSLKDGIHKWTSVEIPWDKIIISTIDDHKFGTLFEFNLGQVMN